MNARSVYSNNIDVPYIVISGRLLLFLYCRSCKHAHHWIVKLIYTLEHDSMNSSNEITPSQSVSIACITKSRHEKSVESQGRNQTIPLGGTHFSSSGMYFGWTNKGAKRPRIEGGARAEGDARDIAGEGSGEGARWAPPQKIFEKSNLKPFILVHIWSKNKNYITNVIAHFMLIWQDVWRKTNLHQL